MASQLYLRMGSAAGLLGLAIVLVSLDPFLGPTAGAEYSGSTSAVIVNRALKGDRLPISNSAFTTAPDWRGEIGPRPQSSAPPAQVPVGCDLAFSPISSPRLANVYGRCAT